MRKLRRGAAGVRFLLPPCAQSQIGKAEVKPPRPWRKRTLIAAACGILLAAAVLAVLLCHRPKTYEGGASVLYSDSDGEYELLVATISSGLANRTPEEKRTVSLSVDEVSCLPALLGVFHNGELEDTEAFF